MVVKPDAPSGRFERHPLPHNVSAKVTTLPAYRKPFGAMFDCLTSISALTSVLFIWVTTMPRYPGNLSVNILLKYSGVNKRPPCGGAVNMPPDPERGMNGGDGRVYAFVNRLPKNLHEIRLYLEVFFYRTAKQEIRLVGHLHELNLEYF